MEKKVRLLAILIALVLVISVFAAVPVYSFEREDTDIVLIRTSDTKDIEFIETLGADVLQTYETFTLVEMDLADVDQLERMGIHIERLRNREYVGLQSYSFDVSEGIPDIPEDLEITSYTNDEKGYYIVQFIGPIRMEWKEMLEEEGAVLHEFRHRFNFIVEMDLRTRSAIEDLDFVNWVGIYQPAYRFDRGLLEEDGEQLIEVSFFDGVDLRESAIEVEYLGGEIHAVGRNGITVDIHTQRIETIANLRGVKSITEGMGEPELYNDDATWITQTNVQDYRKVTEQGITGTDQLITVCDSELYSDHEAFEDDVDYGDDHRKIQEHYSIGGDLYQGVYHGTHCTGTVLGESPPYGEYSNHDGNALESRLIFQDIGTAAGGLSVPSDMYAGAWQPSYDSGSRAHTNSWGGGIATYTGLAIDGDEFIWDNMDYNILFAMGNSGPGAETMSGEPEGKNFFSVGGVTNYPNHNTMYSSSSRGYADDGRIKPTVLHVAQGVTSADQGYDDYASLTGTSMSTPGIAGQVGQVREYYEDGWHVDGTPNPEEGFNPSNALVRATIINGAVEITGDGAYNNDDRFPNNDQGYGRSMLDRALHFEGDDRELIVYDSWDEGVELNTGESWDMSFGVADPTQEIEVTLAWVDYPGSAGSDQSDPAIVNDLDLEVEAPDGTRYVGNAFTGYNPGYSEPDPTSNPWDGLRGEEFDGLNVEENVLLLPEENGVESGTYDVTVTAHQVAEGSQPFALVVSGGVSEGASIQLERPTGGEYWEVGTEEEIIWNTEEGGGQITHVDLDYSVDGGTTWLEIQHDLTDEGSYLWTIPDDPTDQAVVRATVYDDQDGEPGVDTSDEFTITDVTPPEVTLTSPVGGEFWYAGEFEDITWDTVVGDEPIAGVDLAYSTDGGDNWEYIVEGTNDDGEYNWEIPDETSSDSLVRVWVHCQGDTTGRDTSEGFDLIGYPPDPPQNLNVEYISEQIITVYFDDVSENLGYDTWRNHPEASEWGIRDHGAAIGDESWDWGDGGFNKDGTDGFESRLISPEIQIPENPTEVELTFEHWRDFGDTALYDGGNIRISQDGGDFQIIEPEGGYDGVIPDAWGNPLGGEPGWGGTVDWETATFDLIGEFGEDIGGSTIQLRWNAGTEAWDGFYGEGWRIDDIHVEALVIDEDGEDDNLVTWDASPGDWPEMNMVDPENAFSTADPGATFEAADSEFTAGPTEVNPEQEDEWRWLYQGEWRPAETDDGIGLTGEGEWWGAIRMDLSDEIGLSFTDVAYFDHEEANYAQGYVAPDDGGAPSEDWISTEQYTPSGAGWVELELDDPLIVEDPGDYWIVIVFDDMGEGYFPFGCIEPEVDNGGLVNMDNPHDPGSWDNLGDFGLDYTWALEARLIPMDVYFQVDIVDYDDEIVPGEEAIVDYTVTNQGNEEDTQTIEFYVDGVLEDSRTETLGDGQVHDGIFTWQTSEEDLGYYDLSVASEDSQDEVTVMVGDTKPVSHYNIYRAEDQYGPWDNLIAQVEADGSDQYEYIDYDQAGEPYNWYVVRAVSEEGVEEQNEDAMPEPGWDPSLELMDIELVANEDANDWNFVSFYLIPEDTELTVILENEEHGISGNYESVMYYDAVEDEWLSYVPDRDEHFNNIYNWDRTMGLWIRMNEDDTLTIEGTVPESTTITLEPGWNMVGLPSETSGNHDLPAEVTTVGRFDASDAYNVDYVDAAGFEFSPGEGYWVYNGADHTVDWTVEY